MIGIGLWGDGAPYSHKDTINMLLWNVLSSQTRSYERFWMVCFPKHLECRCGCKGAHTWDAIFEVVVWIFTALFLGSYPLKRHDGISWENVGCILRELTKSKYCCGGSGVPYVSSRKKFIVLFDHFRSSEIQDTTRKASKKIPKKSNVRFR